MADSTFREIIEFFGDIGIYDVVLPFLLVFTIVFAILEKTRVLGTENIGGQDVTRKNLNSMVSFVIAFLVVASTSLVRAINEAMANMVMLLLLAISFMILAGSFYKEGEFDVSSNWKKFFSVVMFVGIVLIFMDAVDWLEPGWDYLRHNWNETAVASAVLILLLGGVMYFITKPPGNGKGNGNGKNGEGP